MSKRTKPDIRKIEPTIVILDAKLTFNGGSLSSEAVGRVWCGLLVAFEKTARASGLRFSWMGELKCQRPEVMQRTIDRLKLNIEAPQAAGAVARTAGRVTGSDRA